jgi:hypothetical protein
MRLKARQVIKVNKADSENKLRPRILMLYRFILE